MAQIAFTVKETGTLYIDPITNQVIESLMRRLGLWDYFGLGVYINNQRTSVSVDGDGQGNIRMGNNRLDVGVTTHFNPSSQMWERTVPYNASGEGISRTWKKNYQSIFEDKAVGVSINELTVPFGWEFSFELTFKSYDSAQMALDRILSISSGDIFNWTHDIVYSYPIELPLMGIF